MDKKYLLPGAALLSLVSGNAQAAFIGSFFPTASTTSPAPVGSTGLGPLGHVGGIGGPVSFTAPFAGTLTMTVDDLFEGGDRYQAFVDGKSLGFTSKVPLNFGTYLSTGTFTTSVPAGLNTFDINDQLLSYIGVTAPFGPDTIPPTTVPSSYSPAGLTVVLTEQPATAVPEPGTLALLGSWLLGFGWLGHRRTTG